MSFARFALFSLSFPTLAVAQTPRAQRRAPAAPPAIRAADLRARLFTLAHDSMGGRDTGSPGNANATEWIASEFERFGLEPAGDGGTYFQTLPFVRVAPDPTSRIEVDGTRLALGRDFLPVGLAVLPRPIEGVQAVYGGAANNQSTWISEEQAAGKLVVMTLAPAANGRRMYVRPQGIAANPRFARAAAVALAELDLLPPAFNARFLAGSITTDTARSSAIPPGVLISPNAAAALLGADPASLSPGAVGRTVHGEIVIARGPLRYPARNVVAVLRGSDPVLRSTYVSLSAHNDHIGLDRSPVDHDSIRAHNRVMRVFGADTPDSTPSPTQAARIRSILDSLRAVNPPRRDSIYNGADDDGSGTVALLEIARTLAAGPRPGRSILFVSHTAEEHGLLGSQWFTDRPTVPRDSIIAEIDADMIGRGGAADVPGDGGPRYLEVVGARRLSREFGDILESVNARQPAPFGFNYTYDAPGHPGQYYCRADHYSYARYGIPSVALSRGLHLDYHQVTDEPNYIDYDALARVATLVRDAALTIANLDHRPVVDGPRQQDPHGPCRQ
ncbi:MAG: M28 family peptidase [Gemmatimonadetes bacterium]|nr:M28 family peptidase [Gemmatimonadota bacterium]